jgi:hypothetical protein
MPNKNIPETMLVRRNIAEVFHIESVYCVLVKYGLKTQLSLFEP